MKKAAGILTILGLFLIFHFFVPHSGFVETMVIIVALGLSYGVFSFVHRNTYDANLKPLNCPKCHEPQSFRVSEEDADNMKYRRTCRKCGYEDAYDHTREEES